MRISTRFFPLLLACATATACGGGVGGTSSTSTTGGAAALPTPVPTAAPAVPASAAQRETTQTALTTVKSQAMIVEFAPNNSASSLSVGHSISAMMERKANGRAIASASGCVNGFTEVITSPSSGVGSVVDTYYYDAACTSVREVVTANLNLNTGEGNGTDTFYSPQEVITLYEALGFAVAKSSTSVAFAVLASLSTNPTTSPFAEAGVACGAVPLAGGSATCSAAATDTVGGGMVGASVAISGSVAYTSAGSTLSLNDSASVYTGGISSLTIVAGTNAWAISGGTLIDQGSGTGTGSYNASGILTQATISVTDTITNETVTVTGSASGITGAVTFGGRQIASFSTDLSGNGSITYADGTTGAIQGFSITS